MKDKEITNYDLDLLSEIGNIGAGNAASALSTILNQKTTIEVTMAKFCNLNHLPEMLGGAESQKTVVFTKISKSLDGYIFFILNDEDADYICNLAAGAYDIDKNSVLNEITNIITGSYIGAIASMIDGKIEQEPPQLGNDMMGALIDSFIAILSTAADKSIIIGTNLKIQNESISGFYIMLLEHNSLMWLLEKFNSYRA